MEKITISIDVKGKTLKKVILERYSTVEDVINAIFKDAKDGLFDNLPKNKYVAAFVDNRLKEMSTVLDCDVTIKLISTDSVIGMDMYRRSLTFLMIKAFNDVIGNEKKYSIKVMHSLGKGYFCKLISDEISVSEELIKSVKTKMQEIVSLDEKIFKESLRTEDAVERFRKNGRLDKERLFKYRRVSQTNIYRLGGYEDYFYGYMLPSTGYITDFDLVKFDEGFVLVFPERKKEFVPGQYRAPEKLHGVLKNTDNWNTMLNLNNVGDMNDLISDGRMNDIILVQEAIMEKQIADIAEKILEGNKKVVLIAGPSSSGKTTFSHRLSIQLMAHGLNPHPVALDNFFVEREETPRDEDGKYDFECLEAMDLKLFNNVIERLLNGETVEMPRFDFSIGSKTYKGDYLTIGEDDVLVCEGIHALNPKMTEALPEDSKFKIYISALTQLNVDDHNRIPTTDGRLLRRIIRDARTRGSDAQRTISMWESVRRGEEKNIFPFQEEADVMFNSALVYELSALKAFAEPLLFAVPRDSDEYYEAKRLLKFLDYFLPMDTTLVPTTSIIKEFIGGGCFDI